MLTFCDWIYQIYECVVEKERNFHWSHNVNLCQTKYVTSNLVATLLKCQPTISLWQTDYYQGIIFDILVGAMWVGVVFMEAFISA